MKAVRKFIFAVSVIAALALNASANVQWVEQDKKPPEKVKEQPKPDKSKDERRDNDRKDEKKNDEKKNDEKKKPG
ncbi:MAG: hypothetical protein ACRD82_17230 [Blastocatellia bacterium]